MGSKDLHESPFPESTITKLQIFEDYAKSWLPVFVQMGKPQLHIFDFFGGTGYDKMGIPGSPIRILKRIQEQKGNLFSNNVRVVLHLNEFEPNKVSQKKYQKLQAACGEFMDEDESLKHQVKIEFYNEDFERLFPKLLPVIRQFPALVYLDQNGIKFLSDRYLMELEKCNQTDFLYFVSSTHLARFWKTNEFKSHLNIDMEAAKKEGFKKIHRNLTEELRKNLPVDTKLKLYPFSLKKGPNIHGLIFGASHPLAVDKFLTIAWKYNGENGDANFDIDEEADNQQGDLWGGMRLTKVESFQKEVEGHVMSQRICNNVELLDFTYSAGHIPSHAAEVLKRLKKEGRVSYNSPAPLVNYKNVHKDKRILVYRVEKAR